MDKNFIKQLLRENLSPINEADDTKKRNTRKDYDDIAHKIKAQGRTQVWVMKKALGWEDDKKGTNRGLFNKMLTQEKNDEGSLYQFDDEQIASIRTALDLS